MASIRKKRTEFLFIYLIILLVLTSFVIRGQPGGVPNAGEIDQRGSSKNQTPQITSIEVTPEGDQYMITVKVEDEDPSSLKVSIMVQGDKTENAKFISPPQASDNNLLIGTYTATLPRVSSSQNLRVSATDSGNLTDEENVAIIPVEAPNPQNEDESPRIVLVGIEREQEQYTITAQIEDENPDTVYAYLMLEDENKLEFENRGIYSTSGNLRRNIFVVTIPILEPGSHTFTIVARDENENETGVQIQIVVPKVDQPPHIISLVLNEVDGKYTMTVGIEDMDSDSVDVSVNDKKGAPLGEIISLSINPFTKMGEKKIDLPTLEPGSHIFTITAEDSMGNRTELQTAINVPQPIISAKRIKLLSVVGGVVGLAILAIFLIMGSRKRYSDKSGPLPEFDMSGDYEKEIRSLRRDLSDTRSRLSHTEDSYKAYREKMERVSPQEEELYLIARKAYDDTMKELKKAHGALDVRILELLMKRARDLLESSAPGENVLNYEASRRLSESIRTILGNPELRIRLRKLREVGYLDPFGET
jgi:hypothetical protein